MGVYRLVGVPKITQQHAMSCWYASARMVCGTFMKGPLVGFKNTENLFIDGLSNNDYIAFQRKNHLKPLNDIHDEVMDRARSHSKNYPGVSFKNILLMLDKYGPLWTVIDMGKHAVVVVGGQTESGADFVLYHDPADGSEKKMAYNKFKDTVDWRCDGILAHYKEMPKAPRICQIISASNGMYVSGEIA